jgi:hypothetical protein
MRAPTTRFLVGLGLAVFLSASPAYAHDDKPTVESFLQLASNISANRFLVDEEPVRLTGTVDSPVVFYLARKALMQLFFLPVVRGMWDQAPTPECRPASGSDAPSDATFVCIPVNTDPQRVLLLKEVVVNGADVTGALIEAAMKPENVLFQTYFPNLLGGAVFTGGTAYSGIATDEGGRDLHAKVGSGVVHLNDGTQYLAMVFFVDDPEQLRQMASATFDFSPTIPANTKGEISATAISLSALDQPLPVDNVVKSELVAQSTPYEVVPFACPQGMGAVSVNYRLTNTSALTSITGVSLQLRKLTTNAPAIALLATGSTLAGVGNTVSITFPETPGDGVLDPGESVDIPLRACTNATLSEVFDVSVLGVPFSGK